MPVLKNNEPVRSASQYAVPVGTGSKRRKVLHYLSYITVEPIMIFYNMAFMITIVVEKSFFVYKACTANHGYNKSICYNLNEEKYEHITKEVQVTVSNFNLWNSKAGHGVPIILALFIGAWSDRRGRKLPLLLGLLGKLYYSIMIVVNTTQPDWPLEYVIYTATLPMAFTGADVAIFAVAFTYLVDITSRKDRTMRVTILEVCYLATMPTGIALGSYTFRHVNRSYTIMFSISSGLMVLAVLYTFFRLEWRSNSEQRPLSEAKNVLLDFFDYSHIVYTVITVCKKRSDNRRACLIILFFMMGLCTFPREEREMMYLYCQLVFHWSLRQFSIFRIFQSGVQVVVLLFMPFFSMCVGWRDTIIVMIGALGLSLARFFYLTAKLTWVFYTGAVFGSVGPIVAPVIRSKVSKIVSISERGKAFSVLSVVDNVVPILSGIAYSEIYNATIHYNPSAFFYLTMGTQLGVFFLILYIHIATREEVFSEEIHVTSSVDSTTSTYLENEGL